MRDTKNIYIGRHFIKYNTLPAATTDTTSHAPKKVEQLKRTGLSIELHDYHCVNSQTRWRLFKGITGCVMGKVLMKFNKYNAMFGIFNN